MISKNENHAALASEVVLSLGHKIEHSRCMNCAREKMAQFKFCYVLLSMDIPRESDGISRAENGLNLLGEVIEKRIDVIALVSQGKLICLLDQ